MRAALGIAMSEDGQSLWFKDAIIYELHVRSFADSNADGIGDFRGLTGKLDYLQDLGVTALWVLPFYPSPLRDDGYDIADYTDVHPSYGTLDDFRDFLGEAHLRGLRVITELVINHTSDQHPWFQKARRDEPGGEWRNFYVWSDDPDRYSDTRIIFQDFEHSNWAWDPLAESYYWHRFYSHQPDLNFDNPRVHDEIRKVLDFWLEMGVDGLRLDAVPYLYEREGTNCENLPETHAYLKELRRYVDDNYEDRMLLAEANQWPEDAVGFFGEGDECHMNFHFPLMPRLFLALEREDRFPIIDILEQTPDIPDNCQWALFLRNHDELTLEMVTDEERDAMYRAFAEHTRARINLGIRRRLAPLLSNERRRIELMNGLLFSLPGTPVLYYGDEIGMGDNVYLGDRNGVRTPMQWNGDRNAGFSRANPQQLQLPVIFDPEYHYSSVNVEVQEANPSSLLWWTKRLIALRKRHQVFGRGEIDFFAPENRKVLAFTRTLEETTILVVANLSRFTQYAELDLSEYEGRVPVELFAHTRFPPIGELPYFFTLGPHAIYWFRLSGEEPAEESRPWVLESEGEGEAPELTFDGLDSAQWESILTSRRRARIEAHLPSFLARQLWFTVSDARTVRAAKIVDDFPLTMGEESAHLLVVEVEFVQARPETYAVGVGFALGGHADEVRQQRCPVIARVELSDGHGVLYDALSDRRFGRQLVTLFDGRRIEMGEAALVGRTHGSADELAELSRSDVRLLQRRRGSTELQFGDRLRVIVQRRLESDFHLDVEMGQYLLEHGFDATPELLGVLERRRSGGTSVVALAHRWIPSDQSAWDHAADEVDRYFDRVMTSGDEVEVASRGAARSTDATSEVEVVPRLVGPYLEAARTLAHRVAEMHAALAGGGENPAFRPEGFSKLYRRSLYQSMRNLSREVFARVRHELSDLPESLREDARRVHQMRDDVLERFEAAAGDRLDALRTRIHGDLDLSSIRYSGHDFLITNFHAGRVEARERRIKRSPLRDVASLLRSFHYAAFSGVFHLREQGLAIAAEDRAECLKWADSWYEEVRAEFLSAYYDRADAATFLPSDPDDREQLLDIFVLEEAVYELGYELEHRPDWSVIPLHGILDLMESGLGA